MSGRLRIGLAAVFVAALLVVAVQLNAAPDLSMTDLDLQRVGLSDAKDVSADTTLSAGDAKAVSMARDYATQYFGSAPQYSRVYLATDTLPADGAGTPVVVIVVPGGTIPFDGPVGGPTFAPLAHKMGLVLDAATGAFLRGFMR